MAFYRHFIEKEGFEIVVATDNPGIAEFTPPYPVIRLEEPRALRRLKRTRLGTWAHGYSHLRAGRHIPAHVLKAARDFRPDVILTVAGSWSWTTEMAGQLARRLGVPLVGSFNDWYDYNVIIPRALREPLERRFRAFFQECDLALCTCEGMQEALGNHRNALIHYPMGALLAPEEPRATGKGKRPFRVLFGGNLGDWYGPMLEQLITAAAAGSFIHRQIDFVVCGSNPNWSQAFLDFARQEDIYLGQIPFAQMKAEAADCDALLLPMGFGAANAQIERTSFKTKFLDYLSLARPIFVWGPDYSSAVRTAREFDSAEICDSPEASACLAGLLALGADQIRQEALVAHARAMYEGRFHPDTIHQAFLRACQDVVTSGGKP
jgi:hypothetical protein